MPTRYKDRARRGVLRKSAFLRPGVWNAHELGVPLAAVLVLDVRPGLRDGRAQALTAQLQTSVDKEK